jgi:hypothetical protein
VLYALVRMCEQLGFNSLAYRREALLGLFGLW